MEDIRCIQNVLRSPECWTETQIVMHLQLTQCKKTVIKLKACGTVVTTRKWGLELSVESSMNPQPTFLALEIVLLVKTVEGSCL